MIDFRSDTVTKPTDTMRKAMANAVVGDDVYGDDPTINRLEEQAALLVGKESALFIPSGTMGNQLAIYAQTSRGDEIILGTTSHIKNYEVGASAIISGVSYHTVDDSFGEMDLKAVKNGIRGNDIHYPSTSLICIENAHGSGKVSSLSYMEAIYMLAKDNNLQVHLDGARLFNAATFLNKDVKEITQFTDTVTFCLSKGLASPIGSLLCGPKDIIKKARKGRKLLGGGMRQVGVLGACGLISLSEMIPRLQEDHDNATYLATKLDAIPGWDVDIKRRDINMVFVKSDINFRDLAVYLKESKILIGGYKGDYLRLACHYEITKNEIDIFIKHIKKYMKKTR